MWWILAREGAGGIAHQTKGWTGRLNQLKHSSEGCQTTAAVRSAILHLPFQFERLLVVATLRNPDTRERFDHLLPLGQAGEQLERALSQVHEEIFRDWLDLSVEEQLADVATYAAFQSVRAVTVVQHWFAPSGRECLTPRGVPLAEKQWFGNAADLLLSFASSIGAADHQM
jgi:hypothetical protein